MGKAKFLGRSVAHISHMIGTPEHQSLRLATTSLPTIVPNSGLYIYICINSMYMYIELVTTMDNLASVQVWDLFYIDP